jgi:3-methyladenine DNA glycosylase AlkD
METILSHIRADLKENVCEKSRIGSQRFFKEKVIVYGVRIPVINKIAKKYYSEIKNLEKKTIFEICENLFKTNYLEESILACQFLEKISSRFERDDFLFLENIVYNYITNWATCDTLCTHALAYFFDGFPDLIKELKKWARSKKTFVKRASSVSLIVKARKGEYLEFCFEICDILLLDKEDLVQKGYGWLLKVQSKKNQEKVFNYVIKNKQKMPRTALRYAIELMPKELKEKAMQK